MSLLITFNYLLLNSFSNIYFFDVIAEIYCDIKVTVSEIIFPIQLTDCHYQER